MGYHVLLTHGTARVTTLLKRSRPNYNGRWMNALSERLTDSIGANVVQHYWSGSLTGAWRSSEIDQCVASLETLYAGVADPADVVVIIAKSNGAQLVEHALARMGNLSVAATNHVEIRLATPVRGSSAHAARFERRLWLTSDNDGLFALARPLQRTLFPKSDFSDSRLLKVALHGCNHHDFNNDTPLVPLADHQPTTLYSLYPSMIRGTDDQALTQGFRKADDDDN